MCISISFKLFAHNNLNKIRYYDKIYSGVIYVADKFNCYSSGYMLKSIFVMKYSPKIKRLSVQERATSSFLHIVSGKYHYVSDYIDFYAESGDTVYLPRYARYTYTVLSQKTECIQVEFDLGILKNDIFTPKIFHENPVLVNCRRNIFNNIFNDLFNTYYTDMFQTFASVYKLISVFENIYNENNEMNNAFLKIEPAIKFIEQNFCDKFYISELAKLCGISQPHLRRLFNQNLGMSPVKYKNYILMRNACNMLCNEELNVSETAETLHFSDIYTFSQLFKKEIGLSPKKYIEIYKDKTVDGSKPLKKSDSTNGTK